MTRFTAAIPILVTLAACGSLAADEPTIAEPAMASTPAQVAVSADPTLTLVGADNTQQAALDEALDRFRATYLDLPDLEVRFSDDPTDCYGHYGGFQQGFVPWRILVCSELDFVITHELAHAWAAANLDDDDRNRYLAARGLTNWDDHNAPWNERGTEDAAFIMQQNLMATNPPMSSATWAERIKAYGLLTGMPSPAARFGCGGSADVAPTRALAVSAPIVFNDNGGWSWFQDERAVIDVEHATLLIGTVANAAGNDGARRDGDIEVVAYDLTTGRTQRATLHDRLEADDHNSAALFVRPDGRYLAMYSRHGSDTLTRWRISRRPGDATDWEPEHTIDNRAPTTYSNAYATPDERRLYAFVRSAGRDPHVLVSDDDGTTWTAGGRLLAGPGRPYVRYAADATGRIHLVTTEQHPHDFPNGIYHGTIKHGRMLDSNGTPIDDDLFDLVAARPENLTEVFTPQPERRAWTIDLQPDSHGHPHVVFSVRVRASDSQEERLVYYYGRFDGSRWHVHPMAHAGRALYPAEKDYTGLVALDPSQPSHVFVSADVHPATGTPLVSRRDGQRHYELFEGRTEDGGATWCWTALTVDSTEDNLRPVVPAWKAHHTALLWLRGTYTSYHDYDLDVVGIINTRTGAHTNASEAAHLRSWLPAGTVAGPCWSGRLATRFDWGGGQ